MRHRNNIGAALHNILVSFRTTSLADMGGAGSSSSWGLGSSSILLAKTFLPQQLGAVIVVL